MAIMVGTDSFGAWIRIVILVSLFCLMIIPQVAFAASDDKCNELLRAALKQLRQSHPDDLYPDEFKSWDGQTFENRSVALTPYTQTNGVKIGNIVIYCKTPLYVGTKTATGFCTQPDSSGAMEIAIDRGDLDNLEDYKAVVYHELLHSGVNHNPDKTGTPRIPSPVIDYVISCEETLVYAKTLILLQELDKTDEFKGKDLTKSKSYRDSSTYLETSIDACMKAEAKTDKELDKDLGGKGLGPDDKIAIKGRYRKLMKFFKDELGKIKLKVMEKKIEHLRDDGLTSGENKTLEKIRGWLNVSSGDYRKLYEEIAKNDTKKKIENVTYTPYHDVAPSIFGNGLMLAIALPPGNTIEMGVSAENDKLHVKPDLQSENIISLSERTLLGIFASKDPPTAIKAALARNEISGKGSAAQLISAYGLMNPAYTYPHPFDEGSMFRIGKANLSITRAPTGVRLVQLPRTDYTIVLDGYGAVAGDTSAGVMKLAAYKPEQLSKSAGIYMPADDPDTHWQKIESFVDGTGGPLTCGGSIQGG